MEGMVTTDLGPVDEILDSGSSSPRIQTNHFNSEAELPLCICYVIGWVPQTMSGLFQQQHPQELSNCFMNQP